MNKYSFSHSIFLRKKKDTLITIEILRIFLICFNRVVKIQKKRFWGNTKGNRENTVLRLRADK